MIVYLDLVFLLNFGFDLLLLITVAIILKRDVHFFRLIVAAISGSFSTFLLFIPQTSLTLLLYKIFFSVVMLMIAFGYRNLTYLLRNIFMFYMVSLFLGGLLYFLNVQITYQNDGLIFFNKGIVLNWFILFLFTPLGLYMYKKQIQLIKVSYESLYKVTIKLSNQTIQLKAFLDTGNHLYEPYTGKPVVLIERKKIPLTNVNSFLVPYEALNHSNMMECIRVDELIIHGVGSFKNSVIGLSNQQFYLDGVDCILHPHYF